jgi:hypothetical protein
MVRCMRRMVRGVRRTASRRPWKQLDRSSLKSMSINGKMHLASFPAQRSCVLAGSLLEVWKTESEAIRRAVELCVMLEADLKEHEECLDSSEWLSKKDKLVAELQAARSLHDDKTDTGNTDSCH